MSYSQRDEEKYILQYFKDKKGTLLEIGAYDGKTFSNTLALIEKGWFATLVEPSPTVYPVLSKRFAGTPNVKCLNLAVGNEEGELTFYDSNGDAISSLDKSEVQPWIDQGAEITECKVNVVTYEGLLNKSFFKRFDFINIDVEGDQLGFDILKQIPLGATKLVCIECTGMIRKQINGYLRKQGFEFIHETHENIIMGR